MITQNTYAKISLDRLVDNYTSIKKAAGNKKIIAILKADAYGHGASMCAKTLQREGADFFAVATVDEAIALRKDGINAKILILGFIHEERIPDLITYSLTPGVYSLTFVKKLQSCAEKRNVTVPIHIKLNTGMNRLGFSGIERSIDKILFIHSLPNIKIEGLFSHFATVDEQDRTFSIKQYEHFSKVATAVISKGVDIPYIHISNSAAIIDYQTDITTAVRPGIILYGINPSEYIKTRSIPLKPVMHFHAKIANIEKINPGDIVSYGATFKADRQMKIATVSAGYADGYPRLLSSKSYVTINGQKAKSIGRICMDMFMIDITGLSVKVGDEVTLFGDDPTCEEIASLIDTIPYELTCGVAKRVLRIYD